MSLTDNRPNPNAVSHEPVARIATERAGQLFQDVILRDAKIAEQQQYIGALEERIRELEQQAPPAAAQPMPSPRATRHADPADQTMPREG